MKSLPFQAARQKWFTRSVFFVLVGVLGLGSLIILLYPSSLRNDLPVIPPNPVQQSSMLVEPTSTAPDILAISPTQAILISAINTPAASQQIPPALVPPSPLPPTLPIPTQVIQPSPTPTNIPPTPTQSIPCFQVGNLEDLTIPSGTEILAGQTFTKTWIFQNTGSCTWSPGTHLVLTSGDLVYSSEDHELGENITPGMSWLLSIDVTAPLTPGTYLDSWKLYTDDGQALTNEYGEEQEFVVLITVLPSTTQISGRIVIDGTPVGSGVTVSLEDPFNQTIAMASTSDDGAFSWTDVPASDQGYNVVFSRAANDRFGIDQALSWVWVGPIQVYQAGIIQLADIDISPLGFSQSYPQPEAVFSAAAITSSTPLQFQWSAYPGAVDYWVDLVDSDEGYAWQSRLVPDPSTSFDGTLTDSSHVLPGEYWWAVGARRWLGAYQQIVYTNLINISIGD